MTLSLAAREVPSRQEKEYGMVKVPPPPATTSWQKSTVSQTEGACVQVTGTHRHVWIRDSKNALGPALGFTRERWAAFLAEVQCGEFDRAGEPAC